MSENNGVLALSISPRIPLQDYRQAQDIRPVQLIVN
jgi:hypothetical protein